MSNAYKSEKFNQRNPSPRHGLIFAALYVMNYVTNSKECQQINRTESDLGAMCPCGGPRPNKIRRYTNGRTSSDQIQSFCVIVHIHDWGVGKSCVFFHGLFRCRRYMDSTSCSGTISWELETAQESACVADGHHLISLLYCCY